MRSIVLVIALMLLAAGGAYVGRPYLDQWLTAESKPAAKGRYQCSMHPQIVSDEPGICPICGMKLQRVDEPAAAAAPVGTPRPLFYRHAMRPEVTSPVPAKDEMGMDYVPVYEEAATQSGVPGHAGFTLSPERQQLIGVTSAPVERRRLDGEIRAVGKVAYDPALYQAIVDYREAIAGQRQLGDAALPEAHTGAAAIVRSAALRLHQLGLSEQQVREITASGGAPVDLLLPGTSAWVYAQVYEYEMDAVHPGQAVTITTLSERARSCTAGGRRSSSWSRRRGSSSRAPCGSAAKRTVTMRCSTASPKASRSSRRRTS